MAQIKTVLFNTTDPVWTHNAPLFTRWLFYLVIWNLTWRST